MGAFTNDIAAGIRSISDFVVANGRVAKTFALEDTRAIRARQAVVNGYQKHVAPKIAQANAAGRDALFTANRTISSSEFSSKSLGYHAFVGTGIGAAVGAGQAYMNHEDP